MEAVQKVGRHPDQMCIRDREKIIGNILKVAVIRPKQRPYRTNNFYACLLYTSRCV